MPALYLADYPHPTRQPLLRVEHREGVTPDRDSGAGNGDDGVLHRKLSDLIRGRFPFLEHRRARLGRQDIKPAIPLQLFGTSACPAAVGAVDVDAVAFGVSFENGERRIHVEHFVALFVDDLAGFNAVDGVSDRAATVGYELVLDGIKPIKDIGDI